MTATTYPLLATYHQDGDTLSPLVSNHRFPQPHQEHLKDKLLLNCFGLEADVCHFRSITLNLCKFCKSGQEDAPHVMAHCPVFVPACDAFDLPPLLASARVFDPVKFTALTVILGTDWINDVSIQHAASNLSTTILLMNSSSYSYPLSLFCPNLGLLSFSGGYKEYSEYTPLPD